MKNRDIFLRDPVVEEIPNKGVATVSEASTALELQTLHYELKNFVCEGQYAVGLRRILRSFLSSLSNGSPQKGIWVSGFFGSGKSHLVKVLRFLWTDYKLPGGESSRGLVSAMPDEIAELLKELDTAGKRLGGLHAAAGKVGDKTRAKDDIPLAVLQVLLQSLNLPDEYPAAQLYFYLHKNGALKQVTAEIQTAGKTLESELKQLWVSAALRDALRKHCPDFADIKPNEMPSILKAQFPPTDGRITVSQMVEGIHTALTLNGEMPLTLLALDELQQFVGDSADRSYAVQEVVEACSNRFQAKLLFVATGQSAITETPNLQRLAGRFQEQISLTDADVETVTRTIVLGKKPDAKQAIQQVIDATKGEIFKHLNGSLIGPKASDSDILIADYPILPSRRRFWERVLRSVDPTGTSTMLRTQLRIVDEAVRGSAENELGHVVAADVLFDQMKDSLILSGALLPEELSTIERQTKDDKINGRLKARLCALAYLIGKLPKNGAGDIGVKATNDHLADLLVEDLHAGSGELRRIVPILLQELESVNDLMQVDGEYRIQTREGSDWANDFESRKRKMLSDKSKIAEIRSRYLRLALDSQLKEVAVSQGQVKEKRKVGLHLGQDRPKLEGGQIPLWVRDGWTFSDKDVLADAQQAGQEDATVFVFIPSIGDELSAAISSFEAAEETVAARGTPTSDEGRQAQAAIAGRRQGFDQNIKRMVAEALSSSCVRLGGGSEIDTGNDLKSRLQAACETSATRLFPKFGVADDTKWHIVVKQAQGGAGDPLKAISYTGNAADHQVGKAILEYLGAGKRGSLVRNRFGGEPYGWPQDAIDGALLALLAGGAILADRQSKPVKATELNQKTIGDAEFRVERVILTATQRIELRQLFQSLEVSCKSGDESSAGPLFLQKSIDLANSAGGQAPLPERPSIHPLIVIKELSGNEQLLELHQIRDQLLQDFALWRKTKKKIDERLPSWYVLKDLLNLAQTLENFAGFKTQVNAIDTGRQLVHDPNPIQPLIDSIASELRGALSDVVGKSKDCYEAENQKLGSSDTWNQLDHDQWNAIMTESKIRNIDSPDLSTTYKLIENLQRVGLSQWQSELVALPVRFAEAERKAIQLLEPNSVAYAVPRKLLKNKIDVETYVEKLKLELLAKVEQNPVQVS